MDSPAAEQPPSQRGRDTRTIALVGLAHGTSHYFHMLLPPLFPLFAQEFGVGFAELGLAVTVFFVVSGIGQALAGFLVDRVGARPVLYAALACFVGAALVAASAQGIGGLMAAAALSGLGNSPFHPIDFTILNQRVSPPRLGHAFSIHGVSGSLGWAAAPLALHLVTSATGSWRYAMGASALWAAAVLALMVWQRDAIDDRHAPIEPARAPAKGAADETFAFLRQPAVWLCFAFFVFSTAAVAAIQGFAAPALAQLYGLSGALGAYVVSGYMVAAAAGTLAGGFLVGRTPHLERTIGACMATSAVLLALVGSGQLGAGVALALVALAGAGYGLAGPSRDMLIKRAALPGATGRVYGTVYSGLDIGFAVAAPLFGAVLDGASGGSGVFFGAALALALGVVSASVIGLRTGVVAARSAA